MNKKDQELFERLCVSCIPDDGMSAEQIVNLSLELLRRIRIAEDDGDHDECPPHAADGEVGE